MDDGEKVDFETAIETLKAERPNIEQEEEDPQKVLQIILNLVRKAQKNTGMCNVLDHFKVWGNTLILTMEESKLQSRQSFQSSLSYWA